MLDDLNIEFKSCELLIRYGAFFTGNVLGRSLNGHGHERTSGTRIPTLLKIGRCSVLHKLDDSG